MGLWARVRCILLLYSSYAPVGYVKSLEEAPRGSDVSYFDGVTCTVPDLPVITNQMQKYGNYKLKEIDQTWTVLYILELKKKSVILR